MTLPHSGKLMHSALSIQQIVIAQGLWEVRFRVRQ